MLNNNFVNKNTKLIEDKACFFIDNIFSAGITAGFTNSSFSGRLPSDFNRLLSYTGKKASFSYMDQKHLSEVVIIQNPGFYEADGLFTKNKNHFLVVKTADCLPLLFADKDHLIGVIHMGWRPAKKGILKNIPFNLADFKVAAGLGLRSCCYQVGDEFREFEELSSYLKITPKGVFFNPVQFARDQLISKGLNKDNFFDLGLCSYCSKRNFFSYRRDKTIQRNLSFIGIN
ncbi:MAG: polyphenol oxidase family protein [Candidatus Omnitrophica bacterium]|nr:polyphenol oxidase family protein [Candidatus Omnitrophota bacterium]MCF7894717.1 polyphenol oxidase family protein [Candidatus Omnitrophota bacterium]